LLLSYVNETTLDWQAYSLDGQTNITISGDTTLAMPNDESHSIQVFGRVAETGEMIKSKIRYFTIDTTNPEIIVHSPNTGEIFSLTSPEYNISVIEPHLKTIWYTIDGGITNFTISELSGVIDQQAWTDAPFENITLTFYAQDTLNHTSHKEVVIIKRFLLNMKIINMSFTLSEYSCKFFVYNESGEEIDFATIQMWWNGTDISSNVENLGDGYYFVTFESIIVGSGNDPILLSIVLSASGYEDTYIETYIALDPSEIIKTMQIKIVEQCFSSESFSFTFFLSDKDGQGIELAIFQLWWDGSDCSSNVQELGYGYYFASLESKIIAPGEDPILLSITISASGYQDAYFETNLTVLPSEIQKTAVEPSGEFPLGLVITISVASAGVVAGIVGLYWVRKRSRKAN
jgi:hypothetical protein